MKIYELIPVDGRASFYGKAKVIIDDSGKETLISYNTPIMERHTDGTLIKLYNQWTQTTGRHIKAFCGLDKKGFMELKGA